jgi:uncharacterized membrane protein
MNIKTIKAIFILLTVLSFVIFFYIKYQENINAKLQALEREYSGIIKDIVFVDGNRGYPMVKINQEWLYFGQIEANVMYELEIGDSISKISGSRIILVYRKNQIGDWVALEIE